MAKTKRTQATGQAVLDYAALEKENLRLQRIIAKLQADIVSLKNSNFTVDQKVEFEKAVARAIIRHQRNEGT